MKGQIQLHEVDFAYPARLDAMIFKGFSINTDAKKSTTLVGHSGSSKSTINGLIKRFYDPLKGIVKLDGKDIKIFHLRVLRKHIALVHQEPILFVAGFKKLVQFGMTRPSRIRLNVGRNESDTRYNLYQDSTLNRLDLDDLADISS